MKKVFLFATMAAVLASCSDDDNTTTTTAGLTGTWKVTALTSGIPVDINGDGNATTNLIAETGCYGNSTLVFGANNSAILTAQEFTLDLDTEEFSCETLAPVTGTYVQDGNEVEVTVGGETFVFVKSGNTLTGAQETEMGTATMVITKH
jgi:hypothetical protein